MPTTPVTVRHFPRVDYPSCWQAMKDFTEQRDAHTGEFEGSSCHSPSLM